MPQYVRYYIEVETNVVVRTHDGKNVVDFTVNSFGFADSDKHSLEVGINNAVEVALSPVEHYAATAYKCEKERLTK